MMNLDIACAIAADNANITAEEIYDDIQFFIGLLNRFKNDYKIQDNWDIRLRGGYELYYFGGVYIDTIMSDRDFIKRIVNDLSDDKKKRLADFLDVTSEIDMALRVAWQLLEITKRIKILKTFL